MPTLCEIDDRVLSHCVCCRVHMTFVRFRACIHAYPCLKCGLVRSVYQMMRGAEMLFAAVFSVVFLHRTLNRLHLLGILCCVVSC